MIQIRLSVEQWIGYNVDKQTCKESKDDCYIKKG